MFSHEPARQHTKSIVLQDANGAALDECTDVPTVKIHIIDLRP